MTKKLKPSTIHCSNKTHCFDNGNDTCDCGERKNRKNRYSLQYIPPMGVSQWKNHGIKYGYDKFFGIDLKKLEEQKHESTLIKTKLK